MFATILAFMASACSGGSGSSYSATASTPTTPSASTSSSTPAGATTVNIMGQKNDQSFNPNPVPLSQGSQIVWHNSDNVVHHIVMNDGSFDSGDIAPGGTSKAMTLSSAGGNYHCTIHPTTMFGSVNVATTDPNPPGSSTAPY